MLRKKIKPSVILIEVVRISVSSIKENEQKKKEDTYSFFALVILFLKIER